MDAVTKKIIRKSVFLFLMLTVSVAGIHRIMMRIFLLCGKRLHSEHRLSYWMPGMANQLKHSRKRRQRPAGHCSVSCVYFPRQGFRYYFSLVYDIICSRKDNPAHRLVNQCHVRQGGSQAPAYRPKAILAELSGRQLAVRITPPDTVCKLGTVSQYQDYPTIELNLSDAADMLQASRKESVFQYLLKNRLIYRWIYNPKISEAFPQIMKRSKAYYDVAQARIRKEEEKRKAEAVRHAEEVRKRIEEQSPIQNELLKQRTVECQRKEQEWNKRQAEAKVLKEEKARKEKKEKYALGLSDVSNLFTQQVSIIRDRFGNRWVKCEGCGAIKQDFEFAS